MPYEITWEPRGVYRRFFGTLSGNDLLESQHRMHADAKYYDSRYSLVDFLGVTGATVTDADLETHLAAQIGAAVTNPIRHVAVVAIHPDVLSLLGRYASHTASPHPIKLFSNVPDARAWIAANFGQ